MVPPLTRDADVHPPLFTRAFVLAWFANAMLNLAGFLFVHLPGFLQQRGAGEAQIGRIMAAQAVGANRELFLGALGFAVLGLILCLPLRDVPPVHSEANLPPRSILATAAQRNLLPVWLAAFTFFVGVVALFNFMKTFVTTMGTGSVGAFFSGYTAIAVALRIFLGRLPDRLGARRMLGFAMSSYAAGLGALSLAQKPWHVVAAGSSVVPDTVTRFRFS